MNCCKFTKRTLFNLFAFYTCENCEQYFLINYINIGYNKIYIYEFNYKCPIKEMYNKYCNLILKDIIINQNNYQFLVLSEKEYEKIFTLFPLFLNEKNDLFIVLL